MKRKFTMANTNFIEQDTSTLRADIARSASWEIEQLSGVAITTHNASECATDVDLAVRGMLIRIRELNGVIMSAIDPDDKSDVNQLHRSVFGVFKRES